MATLIAHSAQQPTTAFAHQLADTLANQGGVTTSVEDFSRAGRYVDLVDAVIVVAPAQAPTFDAQARNFMAAQHATMFDKSLFIVALGTKEQLTLTELTALEAFEPRDHAYFRTDQLDPDDVNEWVLDINSHGAV